jgi:hypothetical protein
MAFPVDAYPAVIAVGGQERQCTAATIDDLVSLLRDRDEFLEVYRGYLARRLLRGSSSIDSERAMISRIKERIREAGLTKLECMVRDMAAVASVESDFWQWDQKHHGGGGSALNSDMYKVLLLTSTHWPAFRSVDFLLHVSLQRLTKSFEEFYAARQTQRTIRWIHERGVAELDVRFRLSMKRLICTTVTAHIVIRLGPCRESVNIQELMNDLELGAMDVINAAMLPLTRGKQPLVICQNNKYHLNPAFSCQTRVVNLLPMQRERVPQEVLDAYRNQQLDCVLVRLMKSRRAMPLTDLVEEAQNQLRRVFTAPSRSVKQRIEHLITSGYMVRQSDNDTVLEYVA